MSSKKTASSDELEKLRARALEMAPKTPSQVAAKLRQNAELSPTKYDFTSEFEERYGLDTNDASAYPDAAKLIDEMRRERQRLSNSDFEAEQGIGPHDTMKVSEDGELDC